VFSIQDCGIVLISWQGEPLGRAIKEKMGWEKRFIIINFKNICILEKWSPSFPLTRT
jgi:hypothetical protein